MLLLLLFARWIQVTRGNTRPVNPTLRWRFGWRRGEGEVQGREMWERWESRDETDNFPRAGPKVHQGEVSWFRWTSEEVGGRMRRREALRASVIRRSPNHMLISPKGTTKAWSKLAERSLMGTRELTFRRMNLRGGGAKYSRKNLKPGKSQEKITFVILFQL